MPTEEDLLGTYRALVGEARDLLRETRAVVGDVTEPRFGNPKYPELMGRVDAWLAGVE